MLTLNNTLDEIMQLDFNTREMLIEILIKRQIEERRIDIAKNIADSKKDFNKGLLKPSSAKSILKLLKK